MIDKRGWSLELISKFFPKPSAIQRNPHKPKSMMLLYDYDKVIWIEKTKAFQEAAKDHPQYQAIQKQIKEEEQKRNSKAFFL
ncbi:hypothetical protein [Acinetobacter variabilis]|uniref:hypothetical protein n=1 Tax=Acinetobacter variabilis TaxID=70346 RepID=UPI003AF93FDC